MFSLLTNSILISKGKEVENIVFDMVILNVVHQVGPISFNLLRGCNSTEYDFCETLSRKHSEANTTDWSTIFD